MTEVCADFKKLIRESPIKMTVPELNEYYPKRIQCSNSAPAPFTPRVKMIVEHPVFSRLSFVPHLGLLNSVYPTASHSRLEHSLGVFGNCVLYLNSLLNDPYNPLFKQLVNEEDIKCVLLAGLLHDLGHYPLAHEIEEHFNELNHEHFTIKFLENKTKDVNKRTLEEIIENREWGWGVKLSKLKKILSPKSKGQKGLEFLGTGDESFQDFKSQMLNSILDGPIDVDKLDYLLRDSHNCNLKYGDLIDTDRLVRNLTVIIVKKRPNKSLMIGSYEKGQSAAESMTFSRYLLYQSLYWHHTARSIRAMLIQALKSLPKADIRSRKKDFLREFEKFIGLTDEPKCVGISEMLNFINSFVGCEGKELIKLLQSRKFYKRILTIHNDISNDDSDKNLLEKFREKIYGQTHFNGQLRKSILERYLKLAPPKVDQTVRTTQQVVDNTISILTENPNAIVCDCPRPVYGTDNKKLQFIPEPQRLLKHYSSRSQTGERVSEVWQQVHKKLMDIASKGRVFCHPDIRDSLLAVLGPEVIRECLDELIR